MHRSLAVAILVGIDIAASSGASADESKIAFWNSQRRGANCFNEVMRPVWWSAARDAGIGYVRLAPNKWKSESRDFLLGNADHYDGLVRADLRTLLEVLTDAESVGLPVVLTMLSLPGSRWRQQNGERFDLRMWTDTSYWLQSAAFWRDLASELRGVRSVVGYNVLNEPIPFQTPGISADSAANLLNGFYEVTLRAIREVDSVTPIILGGDEWASASGLTRLRTISDENVLYAVHMYEPFEYTNRKSNGGRLCYPGVLVGAHQDSIALNRDLLERILAPVSEWQAKHKIPSSRIVLEEFGCHRTSCGASQYLSDVIAICNDHQWHWAFYSFREDTWDGMDYELGTQPPGWKYWKAIESGKSAELPRVDNPVWNAIQQGLRPAK